MSSTPQNYADPVVTINTSLGSIDVELFTTKAPITVNNFLTYAHNDFYDNTIFHRVVSGFVDQGGGYTSQLQLKATLPPIALESQNGLSNLHGTIAMARTSDPNSATSQFYFNAVDNSFLDYVNASSPGYAVFGGVIQGIDVVDQINRVPVNSNSVPLTPVVIQSVITTMCYPGSVGNYTISTSNGQLSVAANAAPLTASDASILSKTEVLQFTDATVTVASSDNANVARLYQAAFGRHPDAGGLAAWENVYNSVSSTTKSAGTTTALALTPVAGLPNIAYGFTNSTEFQTKYGPLSNADYLTQIYNNVLGRVADTSGYNAWLTAMNTGGYTKEMVLVGFAESPENVSLTGYSASHTSGWLLAV
ncbi:MAG TPA: DUF4214 domain-containing protein [Rhodospirillaceae bacterium]|nr:DUF4214 domain-containing protein [Rhodospirillaceae bacterium]